MIDKLKIGAYGVKINPDYEYVTVKFNGITKKGEKRTFLKVMRNSIPNKHDLFVSINDSTGKVNISGNLRKWWFADRSRLRDMNIGDTRKAFKLIAKRLGITFYKLITEFKYAYLELGANVKMRAESKNIIQGIYGYPRLERMMYRSSSVYFTGTKYSILFYDKLLEMSDNEEISKRCYKKLSKHLFVMRYEFKINAISGYKHYDKIKTPFDLFKNWDFMVDEWNEIIHRLIPVDVLSKIRVISDRSLTPTQMFEYFSVMGMIALGVEKVSDFIDTKVTNRLSMTRKKMYRLYNKYKVGDHWHYFTELSSATALKAGKMKSNIPIKLKNELYL